MKLFLPLVLAFSFSIGQSASANPRLLFCTGSRMNVIVNLVNGDLNFFNLQGKIFASDTVFNVTSYPVKTSKYSAVAYTLNLKKYGMLKAQIRNEGLKGFAELDHEGQFTDDETGGEEIVELNNCAMQ